jgi:hypothetical protein
MGSRGGQRLVCLLKSQTRSELVGFLQPAILATGFLAMRPHRLPVFRSLVKVNKADRASLIFSRSPGLM